MGLIEDVAALGADTEDALARCMDKPALYESMLKNLPKVVEGTPVMPYVQSGDLNTAMSNAHALKGVMGNLSLMPLYNNYTEIVELFRGHKQKEATELLEETLGIQQTFLDCIKKYE